MTTKLTLSIEEEAIRKAKLVSRRKGKSLSKMVEEYLRSVAKKENSGSAVEKINAILKGKIVKRDVDWKKVKSEHLKQKYGL